VVGVSIGDIPLPGELPTSFMGEPYRRSFAVRLEQRRELFQKLKMKRDGFSDTLYGIPNNEHLQYRCLPAT